MVVQLDEQISECRSEEHPVVHGQSSNAGIIGESHLRPSQADTEARQWNGARGKCFMDLVQRPPDLVILNRTIRIVVEPVPQGNHESCPRITEGSGVSQGRSHRRSDARECGYNFVFQDQHVCTVGTGTQPWR